MKFKGLITLILTVCLAVLTSNAMAKGKKSGKSDKSAEHSGKSAKNARSKKSGKRGKGLGHCKSDKSGKGHSKKRGRGHDRDCDDDEEPPVLVCTATANDVIEFREEVDVEDPETGAPLGKVTLSISYDGPICDVEAEIEYLEDVIITDDYYPDGGETICTVDSSTVSALNENETNFWYDLNTDLICEENPAS